MKYNIISYFLTEGFRNIFKNKKSTFSCLGVMCATMLIFGLFFTIGKNINSWIQNLEQEQGMQVFMEYDATEEEISKLKEDLSKIEGVNSVTFVSKEDAYNTMKERFGKNENALRGFTADAFSVSYMITLTDLNLNNQVYEAINSLETVREIQNKRDTIETLSKVGNTIQLVTFTMFAILILISLFIISNTIKLTVHARRKEISIMKYVGATNGFIRTPFIIEGIIIGLISGILSILIVGGGYNYIATQIAGSETWQKLSLDLVSFGDMIGQIVLVYMVLGVGIGIIGSSISMRKYLDV
ncbi:MAG: permease-like cell division protein FtsX [Clostridia bacterium]|nr:permease-like cell division protein FtsX [Clostridia bacterium]